MKYYEKTGISKITEKTFLLVGNPPEAKTIRFSWSSGNETLSIKIIDGGKSLEFTGTLDMLKEITDEAYSD